MGAEAWRRGGVGLAERRGAGVEGREHWKLQRPGSCSRVGGPRRTSLGGLGDEVPRCLCSPHRTRGWFSLRHAVARSGPRSLRAISTTDTGLTCLQIPLSQDLSLRARVRGSLQRLKEAHKSRSCVCSAGPSRRCDANALLGAAGSSGSGGADGSAPHRSGSGALPGSVSTAFVQDPPSLPHSVLLQPACPP